MISKYVLAGGPGAGKTFGIEYLQKTLLDRGYSVYVICETATELMNAGLDRGDKEFPYYNFSLMLYKELMFEKVARQKNEDAIILCDRGRMDPKAYRGNEVFQDILGKYTGMTEESVLNSYDGILFLQTAADGLEKNYKVDEIRVEKPEQAIEIQKKLFSVWSAHRNLMYIPNELEFDDKLKNIERVLMADLDRRLARRLSANELIEFSDSLSITNKDSLKMVEDFLSNYRKGAIDMRKIEGMEH